MIDARRADQSVPEILVEAVPYIAGHLHESVFPSSGLPQQTTGCFRHPVTFFPGARMTALLLTSEALRALAPPHGVRTALALALALALVLVLV
jgi:hypothetical protein